MKKILYHSAFAFLAAFLLGACSPEDFSGANGELPNIADYATTSISVLIKTSIQLISVLTQQRASPQFG